MFLSCPIPKEEPSCTVLEGGKPSPLLTPPSSLLRGLESPHSSLPRLRQPPRGAPRRFSGRPGRRQRRPPLPRLQVQVQSTGAWPRASPRQPFVPALTIVLYPALAPPPPSSPCFLYLAPFSCLDCKLHRLVSWFSKHSNCPALSTSLYLSIPCLGIPSAHTSAAEGGGGLAGRPRSLGPRQAEFIFPGPLNKQQ